MVVTHGLLPASQAGRGQAVTIGNFDGVHRGHRALLERVTGKARELKIGSCVLTFEPHPREFFAGGQAGGKRASPARLTPLPDQPELMAPAGPARGPCARFHCPLPPLSALGLIREV